MDAQSIRDELVRMLDEYGQDVELRRYNGTTQALVVAVACRAWVRVSDPVPMGNGVTMGDMIAIMSVEEITAKGWPGAQPFDPADVIDHRIPRKGDKLIVGGIVQAVEFCRPWRVAGELIRLDLFMKGQQR
jgi:hypothetical protein